MEKQLKANQNTNYTKPLFNYVAMGDIHLGHMNNDTAFIVNNLRNMVYDNLELFKNLSAIFINGDLFDRLLVSNSDEYQLIVSWMTELMGFCKGNNIKLRLLEGTPLHDSAQGKIFKSITDKVGDLDFKYISEIHIEHFDEYNLDVLYVPDINKKVATERFKDIKELMKYKGLTKVDLTMLHGQFHYQIPTLDTSSHNEDDFLSITNYYINTNHYHTSTVYERILASGSFDRLKHNEEEAKGLMHINIYSKTDFNFKFIKNDNARVFKTLTLPDEITTNDLEELYNTLDKLPETSFIRIRCKKDTITIKTLEDKYNFTDIKLEHSKDNAKTTNDIFKSVNVDYVEIDIRKDNIVDLLKDEIGDEFTDSDYSVMTEEIEEMNL